MSAAAETRHGRQGLDISDLGRPDTLRYNVLTFVINEEYDRALKALKDFIEGDSDYPDFKSRNDRYVSHATDLIYAIRTKRNFPGINALTRTKQQELRDKFKEHFKELKTILRKIEVCLEELRLNDAKTTRILVKSVWLATFALFVSGLFIEFYQGMGMTSVVVFNEFIDKTMNWLFRTVL
ncbi:MAG: hypothetical protein H7256_13185 [Bdellovibrio sp.]|nr:hypothetical protein [Bdellovibrio sp.]